MIKFFINISIVIFLLVSCQDHNEGAKKEKDLERVFYYANLLISSDIEFNSNMTQETDSLYGKSDRTRSARELSNLARRFDRDLNMEVNKPLTCDDLALIEQNYLKEIPKVLGLNSMEELDELVLVDFDLLMIDLKFPITENTCKTSILNKELLELEKLKFKIIASYSMNYLYQ